MSHRPQTPFDEATRRRSKLEATCSMPDRWLMLKRVVYSLLIVGLAVYWTWLDGNTTMTFAITVGAILIINFIEVREIELAGLVTLTLFPSDGEESQDDD